MILKSLITSVDGACRRAGELLARPVTVGAASYVVMTKGLPWAGMAIRSNPWLPSTVATVAVTALAVIGTEVAFGLLGTDPDTLDEQAEKAAARLSRRAGRARGLEGAALEDYVREAAFSRVPDWGTSKRPLPVEEAEEVA